MNVGDLYEPDRGQYREPSPTWTEARQSTDHADKAYEAMIQAKFAWQDGPELVAFYMDCAKVSAQLALVDKIEEITATLKEVANRQIDSAQDLDRTIQKATNALVREVRRATVKEVA